MPEVCARGQGGLLDVCLHPSFARNGMLYLSYSATAGRRRDPVARAELGDGGLRDVTPIFEALPLPAAACISDRASSSTAPG